MDREPTLNQQIADTLRQAAALLEQQEANPFRVSAYYRAADTVAGLQQDLSDILALQGVDGLLALPTIGASIAAAICEILRTGRWSQLERLRGALDPERLFQSIPGVGPQLARRLHDTLHVDTLEALEIAAHDGRLDTVPGIGPRRAAMLRATLATMLGRPRRLPCQTRHEPAVEVLLDTDQEYRHQAEQGRLLTLTPRRFNPEGKAWLPVLHTQRGIWHVTVLYSNTARAHAFHHTHDWVVVYFSAHDHQEGQRTIVTETHGPLLGKRVVRGREAECRTYYATAAPPREDGTPAGWKGHPHDDRYLHGATARHGRDTTGGTGDP
jgi:putative hydrolase